MMVNKFRLITKSRFIKNILIIMTGTALAQIITFIFMPLITRLYGPGPIGVLGTFTAITTILGPVACLTYPIAIVLPKSDSRARVIAKLSIIISIIAAIFMTVIIMIFSEKLIAIFKFELIAGFIYLLPIFILVSGFYQVTEQWLIRTKNFKAKAKTMILQSFFVNGSKFGTGFTYPLSGPLIIIQILGILFGAILMFLTSKKSIIDRSEKITFKRLKEVAIINRDFPLYRAPQIFINAISQSLPIILLASSFGPAVAGFYTIGRQALNTPVQLLGKAVQDVLYPKVNEIANRNREITSVILKAVNGLLIIGIIPFGVIVAWGPEIFSVVFGSEWLVAGEYARWISLVSFTMLVTRPIITVIPVLGIQRLFLVVELFGTFVKIIALIAGIYIYDEAINAIILFSIASILMYIYLICHTLVVCKRLDRKKLSKQMF